MRILLVTLLTLASAWAGDFTHLSGAGTDANVDRVSFTGTQKWDGKYLKIARDQPKYLTNNWSRQITIPAPPANSSARTTAELSYLKSLVSRRASSLKEIEKEVLLIEFRFNSYTYHLLTTSKTHQATGKLLTSAYHDLAIATFFMKKKYNRVRPTVLERSLGHSVTVPSHPAYPSGHASGAYAIAYLLQELDPSSAKTYLADARSISENREIGGLHYPSDTEAGRLLARQLVDRLLSNPSFIRLMTEARKEWR
jgi:acid phosphatase (class A)